MNQRRTLIVGVIFLLLGCIASLYLALKITHARIEGIFSTIASDSPTNTFKNFQCPLLLNVNETASVSATILNPISDTLNYSIHIEADGLVISPTEHELGVTIPGNQTTEVAWAVTATKGGEQTIAIQAASAKDLALSGLGHPWPTSFREGCGILVVDGPLTGRQVLFLGLTSALIGAVLSFLWLCAEVRLWLSGRRQAHM
jgi:hypothetical protein